ncbi:uncharacterized protein LOC135092783 isoform X1 [Scylla paramamosain]|uniref:uncharacterized protein LOC135092783 isoform X1 n=2 Tax=Scylla paramamosain TaxID=85552 RepID=UPI0030831599
MTAFEVINVADDIHHPMDPDDRQPPAICLSLSTCSSPAIMTTSCSAKKAHNSSRSLLRACAPSSHGDTVGHAVQPGHATGYGAAGTRGSSKAESAGFAADCCITAAGSSADCCLTHISNLLKCREKSFNLSRNLWLMPCGGSMPTIKVSYK